MTPARWVVVQAVELESLCLAYREQMNEWPSGYDDLLRREDARWQETFLEEPPIDPRTGEPIEWRTADDGTPGFVINLRANRELEGEDDVWWVRIEPVDESH